MKKLFLKRLTTIFYITRIIRTCKEFIYILDTDDNNRNNDDELTLLSNNNDSLLICGLRNLKVEIFLI